MANIVAATIKLLKTTEPQDVTLRDVALESGHGHRLIVEWFGGKGGLFAAVFQEIFESLLQTGEFYLSDVVVRPEVRTAFKVFNYMQMHHPEFVKEVRTGKFIQAVEDRLTNGLGMSADRARLIANRIAVSAIGISLFIDYFDLSDDEAIQMIRDEFKLMTGHDMPTRPGVE